MKNITSSDSLTKSKATRSTITAVIPTLNEEHQIEKAIKSVLWCDKVIVMDSGSTDRTRKIAKNMGAQVYTAGKGKSFLGVQENVNWANRHCGTDWVLRVDADEEVTQKLRQEIENLLQDHSVVVAYGVPRNQYFLGGFLKGGDWAFDRLVRLYQPKFVSYENLVAVHEQFIVRGKQGLLKFHLNHYSHPTWKEINKKWNLYTNLEAKDLKIPKIIAFFKMIVLPFYVFGRWFVWHKGYKDGWRGIVAGACRGWYEYLKYSKYLKI